MLLWVFVQVPDDQTGAEEGWIGGEMNGKKGWFPRDYVEKLPETQSSQANAFGNAFRCSITFVCCV
jgi:hypothetical protein